MSIKITTLIENLESKNNIYDLKNEFGLSLLIEDEDKSFIFDTGQTGEFLNNAKKMKIDLENIKDMVLSHSHFDHTGGVKAFTENCTSNYNLFINKTFFEEKHRITETLHEFLGNNFDEKYLRDKGVKINFIDNNEYKISKNITLFTNFEFANDFEKPTPYYFRKIKDDYILDKMQDEIVVVASTKKGLIVICGCSHIGIANILENIKLRTNKNIYGVIGGLHLTKADDKKMDLVLKYFLENNIKYFAVSHCTGDNFIEKLKKYTDNFVYNNTGNIITID